MKGHEYFVRFSWGFSQISCSKSNPLILICFAKKSIKNQFKILIMFRNDIFKGHTDSTEITDYFVSTLITINRPLIYHQFISEHGSLEFTRIYYYVPTNRWSSERHWKLAFVWPNRESSERRTMLVSAIPSRVRGRQQVSRDIWRRKSNKRNKRKLLFCRWQSCYDFFTE